MFGIFKKLRGLKDEVDLLRAATQDLRYENRTLRKTIALNEFKSKHKPMFSIGDKVGDYEITSSGEYISQDPSEATNSYYYYPAEFFEPKNEVLNVKVAFAYWVKSLQYPASTYRFSEYQLFKLTDKYRDSGKEFIKLTTKK